jgi:hypothetical protein
VDLRAGLLLLRGLDEEQARWAGDREPREIVFEPELVVRATTRLASRA